MRCGRAVLTLRFADAQQAGLPVGGLLTPRAPGVCSLLGLLSLQPRCLLPADLLQRLDPQVGPRAGSAGLRRPPGLRCRDLGGPACFARTAGSLIWLLLIFLLLLDVDSLNLNDGSIFYHDRPLGTLGGFGRQGLDVCCGAGGRICNTLFLVLGFRRLLLPDLLQGFYANLPGSFAGLWFSFRCLDYDGIGWKKIPF